MKGTYMNEKRKEKKHIINKNDPLFYLLFAYVIWITKTRSFNKKEFALQAIFVIFIHFFMYIYYECFCIFVIHHSFVFI